MGLFQYTHMFFSTVYPIVMALHAMHNLKQRDFFGFLMYFIQRCFTCHPSDSTVSEDAGIELRTVATLILAVRRFDSDHSARSHPLSARSHDLSGDSFLSTSIVNTCQQLELKLVL